ncbi:LuxR C-terminal-related transcriptional regulator [Kineosporia succinea]
MDVPRVWRHDDGAVPDDRADGWWFRDAVLRLPEVRPERDVLVVAAPPGSGRARLVRQWLRRSGAAWSWISPAPGDSLAETGRPHDAFVVIENAQVLTPGQLAGVIEAVPGAGRRLVLLGRGEVLPPALAVRLAGRLAEVRGADLWWPAERVPEQVAALTGLMVNASVAHRLHLATGGWPAGVLALARTAAPLSAEGHVLAHLTADLLLGDLPDELGDFVLRTSLLPGADLDPELCAALAPGASPAPLLDEARRWGLTSDVWPQTAPDVVARQVYHPLVTAAARHRLSRRGAGDAENLLRAGETVAALGRGPLAADLLLAAGAAPKVLEQLRQAAPRGFRGWEPAHLHRVVTALPEPSWSGDPEHRALIAFAAAIAGDHLLAAETLAVSPGVSWWPAVNALIAGLAGRSENAYGAVLPGFFGLPDNDAALNVLAAQAAGFAGDQGSVARRLAAARETPGRPRYLLLTEIGVEALVSAWAGELSSAQRLADRAHRLAAEAGLTGHPMLATAALAEAEVLRSRGDAPAALRLMTDDATDFVVGPAGGAAPGQARRVLRARLRLDLGDVPAARAELERLRAEGDEHLPPALAVRLALARARLAELDGDLAAAQAGLEAVPLVPSVASALLFIALQRQDQSGTTALMARWPADAGPEDRLRRMLAEAAQALAGGRRAQASDLVNEALVAAEPDGHLRVFLDLPGSLRTLVSTTLRRSPDASHWRRSLAAHLDDAGAGDETVAVTRRELVVLEQLTTDLTHAQIAAGLFVSENTLKSHCRNLYRKLGVHSREEAVRIARVRGWLGASSRGEKVLDVNITQTPEVIEL